MATKFALLPAPYPAPWAKNCALYVREGPNFIEKKRKQMIFEVVYGTYLALG
jgi:hypothetical protein